MATPKYFPLNGFEKYIKSEFTARKYHKERVAWFRGGIDKPFRTTLSRNIYIMLVNSIDIHTDLIFDFSWHRRRCMVPLKDSNFYYACRDAVLQVEKFKGVSEGTIEKAFREALAVRKQDRINYLSRDDPDDEETDEEPYEESDEVESESESEEESQYGLRDRDLAENPAFPHLLRDRTEEPLINDVRSIDLPDSSQPGENRFQNNCSK